MPKVSIVLPCWNGERFLSKSLDSILAQTMTDWELIIVNDCSTDNSPKIAEEYASRDKRIHVIHNTVNKKLPGTLNVGFSAATGQYLTWTSDDNIAKSNWLETLVNYLDTHPETDMVCANMDLIDESDNVYAVFRKTTTLDEVRHLSYTSNVGAAFMYRKTIADRIGEYDTEMFCAEDYDYWVRIALNGRLDYINDNIYQYRQNPDSLTATQKPLVRTRTIAIKQKYKPQWIKRLNLTWYQAKKLDYLTRHAFPVAEFSLCGIQHVFGRQLSNILFCWNSRLRHKLKEKFTIKL